MPASLGKFKQSGESLVHPFEGCRRPLVAFSPRPTTVDLHALQGGPLAAKEKRQGSPLQHFQQITSIIFREIGLEFLTV